MQLYKNYLFKMNLNYRFYLKIIQLFTFVQTAIIDALGV
jgi:hypothetical protein